MSESVNIYDAKARLSELVERAEAGEEIVIARAGRPVARLVAIPRPQRRPGRWKGKLWIAPDFDAPLPPDIQAAFEGEGEEDEP